MMPSIGGGNQASSGASGDLGQTTGNTVGGLVYNKNQTNPMVIGAFILLGIVGLAVISKRK